MKYKNITDWPEYRVGDDGTVWSQWARSGPSGHYVRAKWRLLKGGINKDGYRKVILCKDRKRKHVTVARLILEAFLGPCPAGMECAHKNGIRDDNRLENLRWATHSDNIKDKRACGTWQTGESHGSSLLTEKHVRQMRKLRLKGAKLKELSEKFGVSMPTVSAICLRRLWKHVQ